MFEQASRLKRALLEAIWVGLQRPNWPWPQALRLHNWIANSRFGAIILAAHDRVQTQVDYGLWIARNEGPAPQNEIAALLADLRKPKIAVLMPVFNAPERHLRAAIDSVRAQTYDNWQMCVVDDGSTAPHVSRTLAFYADMDARIRVTCRAESGHISTASNDALRMVTADWVALLDHDDLLAPTALAAVALEIAAHPDAQVIYSDEDKITESGTRYDPYFKPDFSWALFRSQNYLNHLTVHRTDNIRAVGGWRAGFDGSQDYDLNLRILERTTPAHVRHIPKVLYHWRAAAGSTARAVSNKSYAFDAGLRALQEHVARIGLDAIAERAGELPFYRVRHRLPDPPPLVSLIIPTRDRLDLLSRCIASILERTDYPRFEILVIDNRSQEPATHAYLRTISADAHVRVLPYDAEFNFSAISNFGAAHAAGEILGLVNNDIEVISPDWLSEMASLAAQPEIGCVGAKLYYPDDTIQHAGVIIGIGGVAGHSHKYFPRHQLGYFSRLRLLHNLSAVTGACLLVRKSVYDEVSGFDAKNLPVAFNDVDFCLRVRAAGYENLWTPYAELYHHESASRGLEDTPEKQRRFQAEVAYMRARWGGYVDPFYSPNLTLIREDFGIRIEDLKLAEPA